MVGAARRGKQQQRVITHAGIPSAPTVDRHVPTSQFKVHLTRDGRVWLMKPIVLCSSCLWSFRADTQIDEKSVV